jgi:hypothetical protein
LAQAISAQAIWLYSDGVGYADDCVRPCLTAVSSSVPVTVACIIALLHGKRALALRETPDELISI